MFHQYFPGLFSDPLDEIVDIINDPREIPLKKVQNLIKKLKAQGRSIDELHPKSSIFKLAFVKAKYDIAIACLEEGANPHLPSTFEASFGFTCIHQAIRDNRLPQIRLLLWYNPDYEKVRSNSKHEGTALEHINHWNRILREENRFFDIKNVIAKTIRDVNRVKRLCESAEKSLEEENFIDAAINFEKIATIFEKQCANEDELIRKQDEYHSTSFTGHNNRYDKQKEEENEIFYRQAINLYQRKAYEYLLKANNAFESGLGENSGSKLIKNRQLNVLRNLARLGKNLMIADKEQQSFLTKIYRLQTELDCQGRTKGCGEVDSFGCESYIYSSPDMDTPEDLPLLARQPGTPLSLSCASESPRNRPRKRGSSSSKSLA